MSFVCVCGDKLKEKLTLLELTFLGRSRGLLNRLRMGLSRCGSWMTRWGFAKIRSCECGITPVKHIV